MMKHTERITIPTEDITSLVKLADIGDTIAVHYEHPLGESVEHGSITGIEREFGDIRFGESYVHVNPRTGDYYYHNSHRAVQENGYKVNKVVLQ